MRRAFHRITHLTRCNGRVIFRVLSTVHIMSRVSNRSSRQVHIVQRSVHLISTPTPRMTTITHNHTRPPYTSRCSNITNKGRLTPLRLIRHLRHTISSRIHIITNVLRLRRLGHPFRIKRAAFTRLRIAIPARTTQRSLKFRAHLRLTCFNSLHLHRVSLQVTRQINSIRRRVLNRHHITYHMAHARRYLILPYTHPKAMMFLTKHMKTRRKSIFTFKPRIRIRFSFKFRHNQSLRSNTRIFLRFIYRRINLIIINIVKQPMSSSSINIKTRIRFPTTMTSRTSSNSYHQHFIRSRFLHLITSNPNRQYISNHIMCINRAYRQHLIISSTTRPP